VNIEAKPCAIENFMKGRPNGHRPLAIVLHVSDGTLASADAWFNNSAAQVSAHYIVARDGAVHQYVDEMDTAYHAGRILKPTWRGLLPGVNPNFYTIGIEHEGRPADTWPERQYGASAELIGAIARRWGIKVDADHLPFHREIYAGKTCPGFVFDRNKLIDLVGMAVMPAIGEDLTILRKVNIRSKAGTDGAVRQILLPGATTKAVAIEKGEIVSGNSAWYKLQDGYIWAGATNAPRPQV
jgi:N-acetyl-anhydromuramyl-L-alanine amidase AmpD